MSSANLHIVGPDSLSDALRSGRVRDAFAEVAHLAGAGLSVAGTSAGRRTERGETAFPVTYRGEPHGRVCYQGNGNAGTVKRAARAVTSMLEHLVDREMAVTDLAEEMMAGYEELNMLYSLLPNITARVHAADIGEALVDETMRTLRCQRVSLLVLDESRTNLRVLAARGLPAEVHDLTIPMEGTISGRTISQEDCLIVNRAAQRPDLMGLSRGDYISDAFAVVRVPLQARGEAVGILTATDREGGTEFTARDRKLLEGLSAMGASALLNCRLHGAINRQMISTIQALASAIDAKDQYTHAHSARVAHLCVATAQQLGHTDPEALREVELAGLLHDIGKIGIPDAILAKPGRLTPEEFAAVQKHAEIGAGIVEQIDGLERVAAAIRHHHERVNGMGYPAGLSGEEIPFTSRLIGVADVYDVLTSDRPYRTSIGTDNALKEVIRSKGTHLDPAVVNAFVKVIERERANGPT